MRPCEGFYNIAHEACPLYIASAAKEPQNVQIIPNNGQKNTTTQFDGFTAAGQG